MICSCFSLYIYFIKVFRSLIILLCAQISNLILNSPKQELLKKNLSVSGQYGDGKACKYHQSYPAPSLSCKEMSRLSLLKVYLLKPDWVSTVSIDFIQDFRSSSICETLIFRLDI